MENLRKTILARPGATYFSISVLPGAMHLSVVAWAGATYFSILVRPGATHFSILVLPGATYLSIVAWAGVRNAFAAQCALRLRTVRQENWHDGRRRWMLSKTKQIRCWTKRMLLAVVIPMYWTQPCNLTHVANSSPQRATTPSRFVARKLETLFLLTPWAPRTLR